MTTVWTEVNQEVLMIADEIINRYHPELLEAKVGFIFRDTAQTSNGRKILGAAQKVQDKFKLYLDLDFIIWLAWEEWQTLTHKQKRALVDHELCHCQMVEDQPKMRPHDLEEFRCIIERYGLWNSHLWLARDAMSMALEAEQLGLPIEAIGLKRQGAVLAVKPEQARMTEA